jgi:HEAT repeat protein
LEVTIHRAGPGRAGEALESHTMMPRQLLCSLAVLVAVSLSSAPARDEKEPAYGGKPLGEWLKLLRSTEAEDRQKAVTALSLHIGPEGKAAVPDLTRALKDEEAGVRALAASALGIIGKEAKSAVPALVEALKDKDSGVRTNAAGTLSLLGPEAKAAVPGLIEVLKHESPDLRAAAAGVLGDIGRGAGPATPALVEALKDKEARVRAAAAEALGGVGPKAKPAVPALLEALKDKDPGARAGVVFALGGIGPGAKAAVPALTRALEETIPSLRSGAALALGRIGPGAGAAVPALRERLKDKTGDVRQAAAWALHQIDPKAAREAGVPQPVTVYHAFLGTLPAGFERDDLFRYDAASSGEAVDALVLWLNGDPVLLFGTNEGRALGLNQWLRRGKNELTFSGRHERPVYVKVGKQQGGSPMELAGRRKFPAPGAEGRAGSLAFQVERAPKLPAREELSDRPEERARYEKEIQALVAELKDLARAKKGKEATRRLFAGPRLFGEAAYGTTAEEAGTPEKEGFGAKLTVVSGGRPLRLVFGRHAVLAYVEPRKGGRDRHLFVTEHDGDKLGLGPFQLARVGGKWIFWHTEVFPVPSGGRKSQDFSDWSPDNASVGEVKGHGAAPRPLGRREARMRRPTVLLERLHMGRVNQTPVSVGELSAPTSPAWAWINSLTMARPIPAPPCSRERDFSPR